MDAAIAEKLNAIATICREYNVRRLDLFGSAATGEGYDPVRSDLDFLVEFEAGADLGPWMKCYFDLRTKLEELFGRRVDLVLESALKNRFFVREVNRTRRSLYVA